jgi:uncharacterized membrane protein
MKKILLLLGLSLASFFQYSLYNVSAECYVDVNGNRKCEDYMSAPAAESTDNIL